MRLAKLVMLGTLGVAVSEPAVAQADSWQRKWYWGAQTGVFFYQTPASTGAATAFDVGVHWLITGRRSALYLGFDQLSFGDGETTVPDNSAPGGARTVTFGSGRRLQASLFAIPTDNNLQIFLGGGFAIHQITDAVAAGTFASPLDAAAVDNAVQDAASKAFAVLTGGANLRMGRMALFGQYQFMPSGNNFLLTSEQHSLTFGLRYALTSAHEDVTSR